jgi:hypothetical protein
MKHVVEMASCGMMYVPNFMKIGRGVEGILRFCLNNFKGCNDSITHSRNLCNVPMKWSQVS